MFKIKDERGCVYTRYVYTREDEFESVIISNAEMIFGETGIYFDIKKRIGTPKKGAAILDGYFLDLTFHNAPKLYLVEVELNSHDVYGHIGEQILRFGISSDTDKYMMKKHLLDAINADEKKQSKLANFFVESKYDNCNELLDKVIYDSKPAAIVIIDEATDELSNVMGQLTMTTEILELETYVSDEEKLHRFTPFREEVISDISSDVDADELDTIIVPAREEGFNEVFLKEDCWYAIRISSMMIDKIKYIAAYQVAPVSAVTHIAEVRNIEKYDGSDKYIVYFKSGTLQKVKSIGLGKKKGSAPQSPRYASYNTLIEAKTLDDVWG